MLGTKKEVFSKGTQTLRRYQWCMNALCDVTKGQTDFSKQRKWGKSKGREVACSTGGCTDKPFCLNDM